MPPTTTTSTHCSHWTLHFCVLVLFMVLSGYRCEDICFSDPDRSRCIMDLNDIVTENTDGDNCVRIEEKTVSESASFTCDIPRDVMVYNLKWLFYPSGRQPGQEGEMVPIGGRISGDTNQITINDLRSDDEGLYICEYEASNNPGQRTEGLAGCIIIYSTANFTSPQRTISIPRGDDLILPTHLTFESNGSCGVKPIVNAARLQFSPFTNPSNPTRLVLCEPSCTILPGMTYNFSAFGNITITNADEGYYVMEMQRPCPSPSSVITATYTVIYTSPGSMTFTSPGGTGNTTLFPTHTPGPIRRCYFNGEFYEEGDVFPYGDGCNNCTCIRGRPICTTFSCPEPCDEDEFRCPGDRYGYCMPNHYLCDLYDDCPGGFDEQNCTTIEYTGPPARSVEEGAVDDIDLCLTVTEAREDHIFRRYSIDFISGSATDDLDYVLNYNYVVLFNGSYSVGDSECMTMNISALSDNLVEGTESFAFRFYKLKTTVNIFIIDKDYLKVGFEETSYSVAESAGVLEIPVRIFDDSTPIIGLPLGVRVTSRDGSAVAAEDYGRILTTSYFLPDRSVAVVVQVEILDDALREEEERFTLELTAFHLSVVLVNSITKVVIEDDDGEVVSDYCTVELVGSIEVTGNTATFEFRGVGSGITGYICKLNGRTLPDCSSPLTGLTSGQHRLRVVPVGCKVNQGVTFRFTV